MQKSGGGGGSFQQGTNACQGRRAGPGREQGVHNPCCRLIGAGTCKNTATRNQWNKAGQGEAGQGNAWQGRKTGQSRAGQTTGQYLASKALGAVPYGVLVPTSPAANWSMLVLPTKMAPAEEEKSAFNAHVLCKIHLARCGL